VIRAGSVRFPVEPRDVPTAKAARRLHLTEAEFREKLSALLTRGFPRADETTGMYDLKAIDEWMDKRSGLTMSMGARDSREGFKERMARLTSDA